MWRLENIIQYNKIEMVFHKPKTKINTKTNMKCVYFNNNIVDDIIYYIGTSASDNFDVIDMGSPSDYWFHANDSSSCHIVAKIPDGIDKRGLKSIIKHGALLCKQNTNKLAKCDRVEIIYTQLNNVTKTNILGMVEITNRKIIVV